MRGGEGVEERELAGREGGCCSFFVFDVAADGGAVVLGIAVGAAHAAVLAALERRVAAAGRAR
ncbi:hypothetical protein [Kitasatospora sp. NPDC090308]|uniref:hypothetical protein n=1 Tax=Kitasatospora sp. NPDC090308 TaxID=3364082 RepID=UPI0037FC98E3